MIVRDLVSVLMLMSDELQYPGHIYIKTFPTSSLRFDYKLKPNVAKRNAYEVRVNLVTTVSKWPPKRRLLILSKHKGLAVRLVVGGQGCPYYVLECCKVHLLHRSRATYYAPLSTLRFLFYTLSCEKFPLSNLERGLAAH